MKKSTLTLFIAIISFGLVLILACTKAEDGNKLPPVAEFITDTNYVALGVSVSFTDQSTNEPTEWLWDFGDGTTSTEQNPSHTYNELGTYSLYLIASNSNGSNRKNKIRYLIVHEAFNEGTLTDYDNNSYNTVQIGTQIWMAENLKVTHYPDGTPIPEVKSDNDWLNLTGADDAFCYYENAPRSKYGALYTYAAAVKAAPTGWHLPSDEEWKTLELYIGMTLEQIENGGAYSNKESKLKSVSGWDINGYGVNGTNDYGFSALPGGFREWAANLDNLFMAIGYYGQWWSSTEWDSEIYNGTGEDAIFRRISAMEPDVVNGGAYKMTGMSVRCVKD